MRISDWSSDVCSSDLDADVGGGRKRTHRNDFRKPLYACARACPDGRGYSGERPQRGRARRIEAGGRARHGRSEEHTSELQSLMRISYAVFCLKNKKKHITVHRTQTQPTPI